MTKKCSDCKNYYSYVDANNFIRKVCYSDKLSLTIIGDIAWTSCNNARGSASLCGKDATWYQPSLFTRVIKFFKGDWK